MTTRELNLDGVRTPLRQAGPADAIRGRRVRARQPRLGRRLGTAARRRRRLAGGPWPGTRPASAARARRPASPDRGRARRVHRPRARPARDRARPPGRCTTSAARGACAGRPSTRTASPPPSCWAPACCPAIAGTRSRASGAPRSSASCSWPPPRAPASVCCCDADNTGRYRGRSWTACTTTSTTTPGARCSSSTAVPDVAAAGSGWRPRCARSTGPRSCSGAATTPTCPPRSPNASATPSPRRHPRARTQRPLAVHRRPRNRRRRH